MKYCGLIVETDIVCTSIFKGLKFSLGAIASECISVYRSGTSTVKVYCELELSKLVVDSVPKAETMFFVCESSKILLSRNMEILHREILENNDLSRLGKLLVCFEDELCLDGYSHMTYYLPQEKKEKLPYKKVSKTFIRSML